MRTSRHLSPLTLTGKRMPIDHRYSSAPADRPSGWSRAASGRPRHTLDPEGNAALEAPALPAICGSAVERLKVATIRTVHRRPVDQYLVRTWYCASGVRAAYFAPCVHAQQLPLDTCRSMHVVPPVACLLFFGGLLSLLPCAGCCERVRAVIRAASTHGTSTCSTDMRLAGPRSRESFRWPMYRGNRQQCRHKFSVQ